MPEKKLNQPSFADTRFDVYQKSGILSSQEESHRVTAAERDVQIRTALEKVTTPQGLIDILQRCGLADKVLSGAESQVLKVFHDCTDSESESNVEVSKQKTIQILQRDSSEKRIFNPKKIESVIARLPSTGHDSKISTKYGLVQALERVLTRIMIDSNGGVDIPTEIEVKE